MNLCGLLACCWWTDDDKRNHLVTFANTLHIFKCNKLLGIHTAKTGEVGLWDFSPTKGESKPTVGFPK